MRRRPPAWIQEVSRTPRKRKRVYRKVEKPYMYEDTSLGLVSHELAFDIKKFVQREITKGKPVNVLDWGCGEGIAVQKLAKLFPTTHVVGFSKHAYPQWRKNAGPTYIHGIEKDLFRYTQRARLRFNLIYSQMGTLHLDSSSAFRVQYLEQLATLLKPGGVMVLGTHGSAGAASFSHVREDWASILKRMKKNNPTWVVKENGSSIYVGVPDKHA